MNNRIKFNHYNNNNEIILTYQFTNRDILNMSLENIKFLLILKIKQIRNK